MTFNSGFQSYDVFDDDSCSDEDGNTSSEDEIDIILNGTPEQRRKLQLLHSHQRKERTAGHELQSGKHDARSSSEDEFEKELNAELCQQVKVLEDSRGKQALEGSKASQESVSVQSTNPVKDKKQKKAGAARNQFYDEVYFDSDDDEDNTASTTSSQKQTTHAVMSNDDLLYDPDMDDEDQKWVDKQRQSHRGPQNSEGVIKGKGRKLKMPNSDALLDCPACMTTLCIDCQRHESYQHQYRAMFVMNCVIDKSELLQCPEQASKKRRYQKKASQGTNENPQQSDMFNPVRCTECKTVVGVADNDEVYHFFNVLASYT